MRSSTFLLANASAFAIVLGVSPAHGQVSGPPEVVIPADEEAEAEEGEPDTGVRDADGSVARGGTITVTGSRIRLPNLESFEPTTTLDRRQVDERNLTNVADALNELPGFRGSVTPAGAQGTFGQGVNFVNNYGLGSNRTLTLINGRRFVTSNVISLFNNASFGTQVDLNVIPVILLDRIDTVSTGGAPIYGSDAIAGTVNVILRSQYDGIEVTGLSGITEEGDNFRWNVSGLGGWNIGGRANLTVAVSHDRVRGVVFNDRDFLRERIGGASNPSSAQVLTLRPPGSTRDPTGDLRVNPAIGFNNSTTDGNPATVLIRGVNIPYLTRGGLITATNLACSNPNNPASCVGVPTTNALQFDPSGNLIPFNQGVLFPGTSTAGGDGFRFSDYSQITSHLNRTIFNGFFTFDVTDNIELFLEGGYFRSRADELVQQPTFNSSLFGGASGPLTFDVSNPFVSDQARAELTRRGVTVFQISRVSADLADLTGFNRTEIYRGVAGLRGQFDLFGRSMNWEAYANWGQANISDVREDLNRQNFINAVNNCNPTPARQAAPGGTAQADPNCVPFNPFGEGRITDAAQAYIIDVSEARSRQEQTVYNVNVGGSLFDIWGGPVAFNVGYEHRDEFARFSPSQFQEQGLGRSAAIGGLQGGYNLDEVFGELLVPLVSPETGLSFIESLQFFGRGRYVHNTTNGGFFSWAVGGHFAPIRDIEFRGNFTRSFRSPAITELFLPISPGFFFVPDLCANPNTGPAPEIRVRNCAAFLQRFPTATPLRAATASVPGLSGGNPNLDNEQANSWTAGFILRPRFVPRLSLTADYVSITLNDPIAFLSVADIVSACFDNPDFNLNDPANGNAFCSRIGRDAEGQVPNDPANPAISTGFVNGVQIRFRGVQATMNYSIPIERWGMNGTFTFGADGLYVKSRVNNITGVAPSRSDGVIGDPEFSGQFRARYVEDTWGTNWTVNYVGEQLFGRLNRSPGTFGDTREVDELEDYVTVNSSIWFDPTNDFRLTLSVTNLFNRQGMNYLGVLHPSSFNDLLGRRFAASARLRF